MKQMLAVISIVFVAVLANGNGLSVTYVFFIIVILYMFLISMHLGKHISNYIFILQDDEQQVVLNTVTLYFIIIVPCIITFYEMTNRCNCMHSILFHC